MKPKIVATTLASALSLFTLVAVAQQAQQAPSSKTPQAPSQPNQTVPGMIGGGMMGQGQMMGAQGQTAMGEHMNKMVAQHQQMTELMNKLAQSMTGMQGEKDPAALAGKMAAHRALLEQMRTLMGSQGGMVNQAAGQFAQGCPMFNTAK